MWGNAEGKQERKRIHVLMQLNKICSTSANDCVFLNVVMELKMQKLYLMGEGGGGRFNAGNIPSSKFLQSIFFLNI